MSIYFFILQHCTYWKRQLFTYNPCNSMKRISLCIWGHVNIFFFILQHCTYWNRLLLSCKKKNKSKQVSLHTKVQGYYELIQSYHRLFILQIFRHIHLVLCVCAFCNVLPYDIHQDDITHHNENGCSGVTSPPPHPHL